MTIPIRYSIVAADAGFARTLGLAMRLEAWRLRFKGERIAVKRIPRAHADVTIYAFERAQFDSDAAVETVRAGQAGTKIVLQFAATEVHGTAREETDRLNRIIAEIARGAGAQVVLMADLMQTGVRRRLNKSGKPNWYGYLAIAHVVLKMAKTHALRAVSSPTDVPDAQTALRHLVWEHPHLPADLSNGYERQEIADFLDGVVSFTGYRSWGRIPMGEPIDWSQAGANLSWQSYFNGLDFVRPALAFWFDFANDRGKRHTRDIVGDLGARGMTPDDCLRRVSFVVADFVRRNPPDAPMNQRAYAEGTISRRVKVLLQFLVCCARARKRGLTIGADELALAWQGLTHAFAMLQSDEMYPGAGNHGLRQDTLFMLAGLLFPTLPYTQDLAQLGLERMQQRQFKRALSSDGVWLENSFGYHCGVMNTLRDLAADLRDGGAPASDEIHGVLARMWPFVEALIKPDGTAPLIGDTAPRTVLNTLSDVREELDREAGKGETPISLDTFQRSKDTFHFPNTGYFVSHSERVLSEAGSTAIFFANLSTPKHKQSDDLSVIFSRGSADLLVDGGTYNKEVSDTVRNTARFDPASHNSFRVNGKGYALRAMKGAKPAGLDGMWEGDGWAAARGYNHAYEDAKVSRLVIHLKRHHALIVLDRLISKTSNEALFEQFWHIAPAAEGRLLHAFGGGGDVMRGHGGPNDPIAWLMLSDDETVPTPYLRRALRAKEGVMASLFQASDATGGLGVRVTPAARGTIEIAAHGIGFACRFAAGDGLECLELR